MDDIDESNDLKDGGEINSLLDIDSDEEVAAEEVEVDDPVIIDPLLTKVSDTDDDNDPMDDDGDEEEDDDDIYTESFEDVDNF